jgi:hypothetical protein
MSVKRGVSRVRLRAIKCEDLCSVSLLQAEVRMLLLASIASQPPCKPTHFCAGPLHVCNAAAEEGGQRCAYAHGSIVPLSCL